MERIIGALVLLILLFLILSISRKNNGSGFFAGLIGGIVGGGLLYKLLSSGSSGNSATDVDMASAETATQQSESTITDMRERASEVSSGQRPESDAPEPSDLYEAVVNIEEPINAFKLMIESSGRDLEDILQKSKTFLELRNEEKEKLNTINEALGPGKGVVYELRQLSGREDVVTGTEDNIANNIINNIESIESAIEEIESNQSNYEGLLSQEEHQLVNDMRQNLRSLKDIEACIDAISQTSEVEEAISRMTNKAQSHHDLQLTNQEIQKIESTIEQILRMEENIIEKLEELRQVEQQTEKTTEEEINEIKTVLEGANSVENLAQQASERSNLTEDQKNKILEVTEKLKQALNTLGADLETEEKEEEQIEDKASEAEQEVSDQIDREERELLEAEAETTREGKSIDEHQKSISSRDFYNTNPSFSYDYLERLNPQKWKGLMGYFESCYENGDNEEAFFDSSFRVFKLRDPEAYDDILYAPDSSRTSRDIKWGDASWFYVVNGELGNEDKVHYASSNPKHVAIMAEEADNYLMSHNIDYHFKVDINKKYQYRDIETHILIIYVNDGEPIADKLESIRNNRGLPPTDPYKEQYEDKEEYKRYKGFVINYYELR